MVIVYDKNTYEIRCVVGIHPKGRILSENEIYRSVPMLAEEEGYYIVTDSKLMDDVFEAQRQEVKVVLNVEDGEIVGIDTHGVE